MNRELTFDTKHIKTYKTADNARAAVTKAGFEHIRHLILQADNGRFHPLFLGQEAADAGVHFHFCVA
jgi:hypothetical protein